MKKNSLIVIGLVFILFLVLTPNLSAQAQSEQINLLTKSIEEYHSENYNQSLKLNKSIDLMQLTTQARLETLYYRTMIYLALGDISSGKQVLESINEKGYDFGLIHYELAKIYLNLYTNFDSAEYNLALEEFKKARSLGINSAQFHRDYAFAYMGLNNNEMAIQQLEIAIGKDKINDDYLNLANLYKEVGNFDKSEEYYKLLLANDYSNITAYIEYGDLLINQKRYNQAVNLLSEGVRISPDSLIVNYMLGLASYQAKDYIKAEKYLLKTINLKDNYYRAYYYLAKTHEQKENFQTANHYLDQATKYNPDYALAYIAKGDINLKQGNNYQAIANYSTAIQKNPTFPESHFHLALAYYQADMKEAAIAELRRTLHLSDGHSKAQEMLDILLED